VIRSINESETSLSVRKDFKIRVKCLKCLKSIYHIIKVGLEAAIL